MDVAYLRQAFTPQQIAIGAAFFHDGETQAEIAERMGVTRPAVSQVIATLERRAAAHNMPAPRRFKAGTTRHVRQLDTSILN